MERLRVKGGLLYERAAAADDRLSKEYKSTRGCNFTDPVGNLEKDCNNTRPFTTWMSYVATATSLLKTNLEKVLLDSEGFEDVYDLRMKLFERIESGKHKAKIYGQSLEGLTFANSTLALGYQVIEYRKNQGEVMRGKVSFNQSSEDLAAMLDETLKTEVREVGGTNPCSADCPPGSHIILTSHSPGLSKCWICHKCTGHAVSAEVNSKQCTKCKDNEMSVDNKTLCVSVPLDSITLRSPKFLVGVSLSAIAGAIKIFTAIFIFLKRTRPVIRASDHVFCYLFLSSLFIGDILAVITLLEPSNLACKMEFHICTLFVCTTCSNLFYRSLKIYKIFMAAANFKIRRPLIFKFLTRPAQFSILAILVGVSAVLAHIAISNGAWTYHEALVPHQKIYKVCTPSTFFATSFPFLLPCILLLGTLILAYKMRLFPHNYKETTTIFNTSLILVMVCLIFLSGYSISEASIKATLRAAIYFCISQTFFLCLFLPKMLVLIKGEDLQGNDDVTNALQNICSAEIKKEDVFSGGTRSSKIPN